MKLSVIVPVYNEVRTLGTVLDALRRVPLDTEIIVVDGDSDDGTKEVLRREADQGGIVAIFQPVRNGRGGLFVVPDGVRTRTHERDAPQDHR